MPRVVDMVPNPWLPYMDGQIWEFTEEEMRGMPQWQPTHNYQGEICGHKMIQWYLGGRHYVRFYNDTTQPAERDPSVLAGWKDPVTSR